MSVSLLTIHRPGWKCCKPRVLTFEEFLSIPPCTKGPHSATEDLAAAAAAEEQEKAAAEARAAVLEAAQERRRQPVSGGGGSGAGDTNATATTTATTTTTAVSGEVKEEEEPESDTDSEDVPVQPGQLCRRRGCSKPFTGPSPSTKKSRPATSPATECVHHPGFPIFHEGSKGWSCCRRRVLEFDQFVTIVGCTTRPYHLFVGSGKSKAEKRAEAARARGEADDGAEEVLGNVRRDMYQSTGTVTVSFYLKGIVAEKSKVLFVDPNSTSESEDSDESTSLYLDLVTDPVGSVPARHLRSTVQLFGPIDPTKSSFEIKKFKLELVLAKKVRGDGAVGWPGLTKDEASSGEIYQVGAPGRA